MFDNLGNKGRTVITLSHPNQPVGCGFLRQSGAAGV